VTGRIIDEVDGSFFKVGIVADVDDRLLDCQLNPIEFFGRKLGLGGVSGDEAHDFGEQFQPCWEGTLFRSG